MIVRAALPLLTTLGPAVTTAQVARAAGIGEATVFRAFADKDALLRACVAEVLRPDTVLAELAAIERGEPLPRRLTTAAEAVLAHLDRLGAVLGVLHATGHGGRDRHRADADDHPGRNADDRPGRAAGDGAPGRDADREHSRPDRDTATEAVRLAVADLLAPDADRLRLPVDRLAALFLALLTPRGPLTGHPPDPAELVDLFLHGALTPAVAG
ncbi:regulatory protein, tetR family [Micromonospora siamensis]|uniref:Regulatory protein, tetR family n=2 Tax=Micromonospora siamensis TaxID=299152 RepID=A0A1C5IHT4_9ACTN|nr:regulatory protein, tetR family [Micromonospora siamensis]